MLFAHTIFMYDFVFRRNIEIEFVGANNHSPLLLLAKNASFSCSGVSPKGMSPVIPSSFSENQAEETA